MPWWFLSLESRESVVWWRAFPSWHQGLNIQQKCTPLFWLLHQSWMIYKLIFCRLFYISYVFYFQESEPCIFLSDFVLIIRNSVFHMIIYLHRNVSLFQKPTISGFISLCSLMESGQSLIGFVLEQIGCFKISYFTSEKASQVSFEHFELLFPFK